MYNRMYFQMYVIVLYDGTELELQRDFSLLIQFSRKETEVSVVMTILL